MINDSWTIRYPCVISPSFCQLDRLQIKDRRNLRLKDPPKWSVGICVCCWMSVLSPKSKAYWLFDKIIWYILSHLTVLFFKIWTLKHKGDENNLLDICDICKSLCSERVHHLKLDIQWCCHRHLKQYGFERHYIWETLAYNLSSSYSFGQSQTYLSFTQYRLRHLNVF